MIYAFLCFPLKEYVARHPELVVIDYMEGVRILIDRYKQYKLVEESDLAKEGSSSFYPYHSQGLTRTKLVT